MRQLILKFLVWSSVYILAPGTQRLLFLSWFTVIYGLIYDFFFSFKVFNELLHS